MKCREEKILFQCETKNGKEVLLCDRGETLGYSYGKTSEPPELALSVPRDQATTFQWQGVGRWVNYSVTVPNGSTRYTVFTSVDQLSDDHEFEAGVIVTADGEEIARILCREPIKHNLEDVDLKQEE